MKAVFRKKDMALVPVDDDGAAILASLKDRRDVMVDIVQSRNPRHHRLYFAILKFLATHARRNGRPLFENADLEIISDSVKIATGLVRTYIDTSTGQTIMCPLSISWASMDQARFSQFFDKATQIIADRWLSGTTAEEVRRELYAMVDGPHAIGERRMSA